MNSMQIKDKIRNLAKNKNIDFNTILRLYMYDKFIERLAISRYRDNFILKGGFYLSIFFGIESRSTMDIDTTIRNTSFSRKNIIHMIESIISIDIGDESLIEIISVSSIRDKDEYGGYRVTLSVQVENMKEKFQIDIATGDPITPSAVKYNYLTMLEHKNIHLWAYNIETISAEKLETILSRVETTSRLRDYYDIYLIYTKDWNHVDKNVLKEAIKNTFTKREYKGNIEETIKVIKNSEILKKRWDIYSKKYEYTNKISYQEVIQCIEKVVLALETVDIS